MGSRKKDQGCGYFKTKGRGERITKLKELFGDEPIDTIRGGTLENLADCNNEYLADLITAKMCGISPNTVLTYRKKHVKRVDTKHGPAFILKKGE